MNKVPRKAWKKEVILSWKSLENHHNQISVRILYGYSSIVGQLIPISHDSKSLYRVEGYHGNLSQIFIIWVWAAEKVFEVKGQGHEETKCHNGGGMHFNSVASRLKCVCICFILRLS